MRSWEDIAQYPLPVSGMVSAWPAARRGEREGGREGIKRGREAYIMPNP